MEAISDYDRPTSRRPTGAEASGTNVHEPGAEPVRPPLGSLLVRSGFITEPQLAEGLAEGAATGERLGEVVVRRGWATEDDVAKLLAEQWQLGYVDRASIFFDAEALARLSRAQARQLEALPTRVQDGRVVVAVAEPTEQRLTALRAVIGDDTVVVVVPKTALDAGLRSELLSGRAIPEDEVDPPLPTPSGPAFAGVTRANDDDATVLVEPTPTSATPVDELDLGRILVELETAAREATVLQTSVSELSRRLARIVSNVTATVARLELPGAGDEVNAARIHELEAELAQRTAMTETLKAQLGGLTQTLEKYR
ncbi:MAG: hypothetical protein WKF41_13660 [Gaiellaceae bacterium]